MPKPQIQDGVWYRIVPSNWKTADGFRTDIRPVVLKDQSVQYALFVINSEGPDEYAVRIPMQDIRRAAANLNVGKNGAITFSVRLDGYINSYPVDVKRIKPGQ